ncbi:MAG: tetratricopeptide repeat protein [Opitutae bacterium]|nr:tetratricopeptide repeat protein [Opitutae bacterium]
MSIFRASVLCLLALLAADPLLRADGFHAPPSTVTAAPADDATYLAEIGARAGADQTGRALQAAIGAIKIRPERSDNWVLLGDSLRQLARDTLDVTLYRHVERSYLRAAQIDPANTRAFIGLAWAAGASHRFADSIHAAEQALKLDPDLPDAYGIRGDAAVEIGDYAAAARDYEKMLDLRPGLSSYSRAGHLAYLLGQPQAGMGLMRQAIKAGGNVPEHTAWCVAELAAMMCNEGAGFLAQKLVESALARTPDNLALLAAAARARVETRDHAGAIAALEKANAITPQHGTLALLHDLYLATGRPDAARRIVGEIETLHRKLEAQHVYGGEGALARFYADRGENLPLAVTLAEREYTHPRHAVAADTLAWAYCRAGRFAEAGRLLPVVLQRRAADPAMLYHAAVIEEALGDDTSARLHLSAALNRDPLFNPVHAVLAQKELARLGAVPARTAQPAAARKPEPPLPTL